MIPAYQYRSIRSEPQLGAAHTQAGRSCGDADVCLAPVQRLPWYLFTTSRCWALNTCWYSSEIVLNVGSRPAIVDLLMSLDKSLSRQCKSDQSLVIYVQVDNYCQW